MAEVFVYDLQTGLPHLVAGQVDSSHSLYAQQRFHLLSTLLADAVASEGYHLQASHIDYSTQKFPEAIFAEALGFGRGTVFLYPDRSMVSIMWSWLAGLKEVRGGLE
jgi:hypothetical protein